MTDEDLLRERLQLALEAAGFDLWENNLTTGEVTQQVSRVFADLGYDDRDALNSVDDLYQIIHPEDVPLVQQAVTAHMTGETAQYRCEFRLRTRDGRWVWYANYGKIMDMDSGRLGKRFIGVTFNINDRKHQEEVLAELNRQLQVQNAVLQKLATTDALTELGNRRLLIDSGENECRRSSRFGHPLSLLIFDIDNFKRINDSWGHPAGDAMLRAVAELCRNRFREGIDVVARVGGEEFAVLMPATGHTEALHVAERLRRAIAELQVVLSEHKRISCTVSIGVATVAEEQVKATDFDSLLVNADRALYRAKESGRNQVVGFPWGACGSNQFSIV